MHEIIIGKGEHVVTTIRNFDYENMGGKYYVSECKIMWSVRNLPLDLEYKMYLDTDEGQTALHFLKEEMIEELDHLLLSIALQNVHPECFQYKVDNFGKKKSYEGANKKVAEWQKLMEIKHY